MGGAWASSSGSPPFLDLAYLAEEYYRLKNSRRNLETVACIPTRYRVGAKKIDKDGKESPSGKYPSMQLGVRAVNEIPYPPTGVSLPGPPVGWDSPDVSVLGPSRESLTDIRSEMGAAHAAFLAPETRDASTATAKRIDNSSQRASIQSCASAKRDFLEKMVYFTANFLQVAPCKVTVNTNFTGEGIDSQYLAVLVNMYIQGAISLQALIFAAKTGKLPETLDAEDEAATLISEQIKKDAQAQRDAVTLAKATATDPAVIGAAA